MNISGCTSISSKFFENISARQVFFTPSCLYFMHSTFIAHHICPLTRHICLTFESRANQKQLNTIYKQGFVIERSP